jgi:colicin import membrane protein
MKNAFVACVMACFVGTLFAQVVQTEVAAERSRIAAERSRAQAGFAVEDGACYRRFWVNDCLDEVKARRLGVLSDLRRQEVALNDQERKAQGAEQLQKIEEKSTLASQQAQAESRAEAINKAQSKNEREAQKAQSALQPGREQAVQAQANKISAANRLVANQAKLTGRAQKQALDAEEVRKFQAKQLKAKERQDKNAASQSGKTKSPALPPAR